MRALLVALVGTFAAFEPVASEPTKLILTGDQTEVHFVNPVTDESCVFSATECAHSLTVDERLTALEADVIELRAENAQLRLDAGLAPAPPPPPDISVPAGLVGYWPFDADFADYSGSGADGTSVLGASRTAECARGGGSGLSLAGGAYVDVGSPAAVNMDGVSEVSVAFWLKGSTAQSGELWCPISWGHTGTAGMVMQATNIHGAYPHMAFHVSPGGPPPGSATVTMPINIADGQWHHIVFTRSARRASGFLDGVYTGSLTLPDDSADLSPVRMVDGFKLLIGKDPLAERAFTGCIDEVKVFKSTLSEAEAIALYDARAMVLAGDGTTVGGWQHGGGA